MIHFFRREDRIELKAHATKVNVKNMAGVIRRVLGAISQVMTGEDVEDMNAPKLYETGRPQGYVGCKAPMFSFTRLR